MKLNSLESQVEFPYREEIALALGAGAECRKDDRSLVAGKLSGTYKIRLAIACDPNAPGVYEADNFVARDYDTMVRNLSSRPNATVAVYYIGPTQKGVLYFLTEFEDTGSYVGCFRSF